ncbi:hypothetical protein HD554DRAFT_579258 [Boletus coccyginus]|nr:hypothetical protein HD554DRAFT_579258 [Boletus coccyginus]
MPASLFPLALIVPRPNIPLSTSAPRTPNRSPVTPHVLLSPPPANRNSTDSWNSSNYDFEDPNALWKEDQVRLLSRTLDALPAHLITPFNGFIPPSNLLDKIARGVSAAKGPNDWPHSIRATRIKLLELARSMAQEERRRDVTRERSVPLGQLVWQGDTYRARTPDPRRSTSTPNQHPYSRTSSTLSLSTRLQRHDRVLHHPYPRPAHTCNRSEYNRPSPSTPSSSTLNSNRHSRVRKSTISATSASSSSFGSPMSISAPLRPSSLRRASTLTLASTSEAHVGADADIENCSEECRFSPWWWISRGGRGHQGCCQSQANAIVQWRG